MEAIFCVKYNSEYHSPQFKYIFPLIKVNLYLPSITRITAAQDNMKITTE